MQGWDPLGSEGRGSQQSKDPAFPRGAGSWHGLRGVDPVVPREYGPGLMKGLNIRPETLKQYKKKIRKILEVIGLDK
jgi:hypothetical protein